MNLEKLMAVSGLPGIYKVVATRSNGIIIEDLDDQSRRFIPARGRNFSPLETISIYTDDDTTELKTLFQSMLDHEATHPVPAEEAPADEMKAYFEVVLPNYDRERVHQSDIKKAIKWFMFLKERDLLKSEPVEETAAEEESE